MNGCTVGILVARQKDGSLFRAQIDAVPRVVAAVSDALSIPRVAFPYLGRADRASCRSQACGDSAMAPPRGPTWDLATPLPARSSTRDGEPF